jgi:hypothetical protein
MQIGVYGPGNLGTVSACLADFGAPVSCCHPDRSRMLEMAQGNIPFCAALSNCYNEVPRWE